MSLPEEAFGPNDITDSTLLTPSNKNTLQCNCEKTCTSNASTEVDTNDAGVDSPQTSSSKPLSDSFCTTKKLPKCCLKRRLGIFFNCERFCDIHFILGQGSQRQRIPAHKLVLLSGSEVFSAMFSENWSSKCEEIEVPDVELPAFLALLRFLYTDEISLTPDTVALTLYAAKKYAVLTLEKRCIEYLNEILSSENAFFILAEAKLFDEHKLTDKCMKLVDTKTDVAIMADSFSEIDLNTLRFVLERNQLSSKEIHLFDAVLRWSKAECERQSLPINAENQRLVAEEVIPLIRFPLMSVEDFASKVATSGFLTDKEVISMFLYFNSDSKLQVPFSTTPRFYKELTVNRFSRVMQKEGWIYDMNSSEGIGFTPDCHIKLVGVGLYGSTSGHTGYEVAIKLIDNFTEEVLSENLGVYQSDGETVTYKALFEKPIQLQAYTNYSLIVTIWGPDSFAGDEGKEQVTLDLSYDQTVTFVFNAIDLKSLTDETDTMRTSIKLGQIPQLLFSI